MDGEIMTYELEDYLDDMLDYDDWLFEDEPKHNELFWAQDGSEVIYDAALGWYRFTSDHPKMLQFKAGDEMPKEWGIVKR